MEFNLNNWGQAVQGYAGSLSEALHFELKDMHSELLRRIDDISSKGGDVAVSVAGKLVPIALRIQRSMGEPGGRWLRHLTKRTLAGMGQKTNLKCCHSFANSAKGRRFAAALAAGACYQWREDPEADRMLKQIAESEAALKSTKVSPPNTGDTLLDDSVILCSYGDFSSALSTKTYLGSASTICNAVLTRTSTIGCSPMPVMQTPGTCFWMISKLRSILARYF